MPAIWAAWVCGIRDIERNVAVVGSGCGRGHGPLLHSMRGQRMLPDQPMNDLRSRRLKMPHNRTLTASPAGAGHVRDLGGIGTSNP